MKIAICFSGAVSKLGGSFLQINSLYNNNEYVNISACKNSTDQHLIGCNPNCSFDFFIHSWNEDLKEKFTDLYSPKKSLFEDNKIYIQEFSKKSKDPKDFGGLSKALSMKKSIELLEEYQEEYDLIMIYRPDIILMKNIDLYKYEKNKIYVNGHPESKGDFHFIMNFNNIKEFKNLYDSADYGNPHETHFWIKNYVNKFLKKELIMDDIIPGLHQEVLRKIKLTITNFKIDVNSLLTYGLTLEDINKYIG